MINAACTRHRQSRKLKCALCFLLAASLLSSVFARDAWHLLIEPDYMNYQSAWPIVSAETTVLVPARVVDGEVRPLRRDEVASLGVTRKEILEDAPVEAAKVLNTLKPEYVRDENRVIQYAVLRSDNPLTASAVLAPGFADQFRDTLGDELLIAIPSRNCIYVFPRLSPIYQEMSEEVLAEFKTSPFPASRELFTFRDGRLIAVGSYH